MGREIDIRDEQKDEEITKIRVSGRNPDTYIVEILSKTGYGCSIEDSSGSRNSLAVMTKEHADNIIAGLQKAIELKWVK